MTFAAPYLLGLLLLPPVFLAVRRILSPENSSGAYSNVGLLAGFRPTWRLRYRWVPTALRVGAMSLLIVAVARPQVGHAETELPGQGIDIALVLDISSSMSFSPLGKETRLDAAKKVLEDFVRGREADQIGLVVFRDESLLLSPLTLDYGALASLIRTADSVNLEDGTAIGLAVAEAVDVLRESKARSRAIVLLTDGQNNNETIQPLASAHLAEALGIRIYAIGVITDTPLPGVQGVDDAALRAMTDLTDGVYFSVSSEEALTQVYANIDRLEKSRVSRPQFASYNELGVYFLAGALALIAAEALVSITVWRRAA